MPIPTELVGSLPRPTKLQDAYEDLDQGKISFGDLQALQDEAAEDSIKRLEQTGETYVTDGEQRDLDGAAPRGELHRVREQVPGRLLQAIAVRAREAGRAGHGEIEPQRAARR